jgi:hypothetical protein
MDHATRGDDIRQIASTVLPAQAHIGFGLPWGIEPKFTGNPIEMDPGALAVGPTMEYKEL